MRSLNRAEIIGNVGRDPEVRSTADGTTVARFSIATTERHKKGESWEEVTEWHNCAAFGGVGDRVRDYVHKGDRVFVEGKLKTEKWTDNESHQEKTATRIVVSDILFLSPKDKTQTEQPEGAQQGGSRSGRGAR